MVKFIFHIISCRKVTLPDEDHDPARHPCNPRFAPSLLPLPSDTQTMVADGLCLIPTIAIDAAGGLP